jgi:hypothetical protein
MDLREISCRMEVAWMCYSGEVQRRAFTLLMPNLLCLTPTVSLCDLLLQESMPAACVNDISFHFMSESCELVLTLVTKLITSYLTCQIESFLRVRMLGHVLWQGQSSFQTTLRLASESKSVMWTKWWYWRFSVSWQHHEKATYAKFAVYSNLYLLCCHSVLHC